MQFLRTQQVVDRLGISRQTLWRWVQDGRFPPRRRLGPNVCGWLEETVNEFLENSEIVVVKGETDGDDD